MGLARPGPGAAAPASAWPGGDPGWGRAAGALTPVRGTPRPKETDRKQLPGREAGSSAGPRRPGARPRSRASGGRPDSCRGSRRRGHGPPAPAPGRPGGPGGPRARREQWRAQARGGGAGPAADGAGRGAGAKPGTKGPFSRAAGGCLHRCGGGCAATLRAGGRAGAAWLPTAPGVAGKGEGAASAQAGHCLSAEPRALAHVLPAPGGPPGPGTRSPCPSRAGSPLGAKPSLARVLGAATPGHGRAGEGARGRSRAGASDDAAAPPVSSARRAGRASRAGTQTRQGPGAASHPAWQAEGPPVQRGVRAAGAAGLPSPEGTGQTRRGPAQPLPPAPCPVPLGPRAAPEASRRLRPSPRPGPRRPGRRQGPPQPEGAPARPHTARDGARAHLLPPPPAPGSVLTLPGHQLRAAQSTQEEAGGGAGAWPTPRPAHARVQPSAPATRREVQTPEPEGHRATPAPLRPGPPARPRPTTPHHRASA